MNKCQHCGTFVPAEKAFCPNCSEPMEPEATPNRAHPFSSDMLATIRDDPEKYRQMLMPPVKKQPEPAPAEAGTERPAPAPDSARPAAPAPAPNYPTAAAIPTLPAPAAKSNKGFLVIGIGALLIIILLLVLLYLLKVI